MRLIDADALIDIINDFCEEGFYDCSATEVGDEFIDFIDDMPTIEPRTPTHLIKYWTERKDGHGIEHIPHCKCANCDTEYLPRMAMAMNYCPNCGARFVKEREEHD